jgi:hypothetical protein
MFIGGYVRFISKIIMAGFLFSVIVPTSASAFTGGMLSGDRTLVLSESPYQITSPIEIPYGTKLTVEPGVEITSETGGPLFFVNGAVEILGSASQPVRIVSTGPVFYPKNATDASIKVSFASIDGGGSGSLVGASGYAQTATYEFSDSDFFNLGTFSYIWYPNSFLAERNVFTNSAGFDIGFDSRPSAQGASAPVFRNNLFQGSPIPTYGESYWVRAWASYGSTLQMIGNTFAGGIYEAIRTATSYDKIPLNAQANFWGTEISSEIEAMVVDSRDGLSYGTVIDTSNFLSSPSPQSPTGRRFQLATSPTPTPTPTPVGPQPPAHVLTFGQFFVLSPRHFGVPIFLNDIQGNAVVGQVLAVSDLGLGRFSGQGDGATVKPVTQNTGTVVVLEIPANSDGNVSLSVTDGLTSASYSFRVDNTSEPEAEGEPGVPSIIYSWEGTRLTFVVNGLPSTTQKFVARFWAAGQVHYATALETSGEFRHSKYLSEQTPISFSISFEVAGLTYNHEPVGVEGKVGGTSVKLVADQKTLASFSSTSTTLTNLQRSQVKAAVEANLNATKFICTGIRYFSQPMSENIKVRKRAKAACDYAKTLNPELSTWYQNKPTEARSYAGKVLLTIKSPAN